MGINTQAPVIISSAQNGSGAAPALHLWIGYTAVDLVAQHFCGFELSVPIGQPRRLTFTVRAAQHTLPVTFHDFIIFTHDSYGGWATPLFEGYVHEIQPVSSVELKITAYDATKRASDETWCMSDSSVWATVLPRRVYNVKLERDPDYAFAYRSDATVGQMAKDILEAAYADLVAINGAPPAHIGGAAYDAIDFDAMDFIPQEKVVFDSMTVGDALARLMDAYPQYRCLFIPGVASDRRKWHYYDVTAAPAITLTLNDFTDKKVLGLNFSRSMEKRFTAVKFYGPEKTTLYVPTQSGGTLTPLWDTGFAESQFEALGAIAGTEDVGRKWQIADATKRRMARLLPSEVAIGTNGTFNLLFVYTRTPTVEATWDGVTWLPVENVSIDYRNGIIETPYHVHEYKDDSVTPYTLPTDVRFTCAYYDAPLVARYPTSGYEGTAYTVFSHQAELRRFDEALAVGYEFGVPVTDTERTDAFKKIAENLHKVYSNVIYAGVVTLAGLDWDWLVPRRINFAAIDADGDPLTTGWEAIDAFQTEVSYDFVNGTTTITFNGDHLAYLATNVDQMKQQLKIDLESQWRVDAAPSTFVRFNGLAFGAIDGQNLDQYTRDDSSSRQYGADPNTGRPMRDLPPPPPEDDGGPL